MMEKYGKIRNLLSHYGVEFIEVGKNVQQGNLNIKCPLCKDDPSHHLGINLSTGVWGCWRDQRHRGKNVYYLLSTLLGLDGTTVRALLPKQSNSFQKAEVKEPPKFLELPDTFWAPRTTPLNVLRFDNYLKFRGFFNTEDFIERYGVNYALCGEWSNRIIFPLYKYKQLVSWHTRSISQNDPLPYKDSSLEISPIHPKMFLWNYNTLFEGGSFLYITEGIFDALKIDYYTGDSIKATCLLTKTIREEQVRILYDLKDLYTEFRLCLDEDALSAAFQVKTKLDSFLGSKLRIIFLPKGKKDPGELTEEEVLQWIMR